MAHPISLAPPFSTSDIESFGPISLVVIQATSFCNINCDYCYLPDRHLKNQISLDLIDPIFEKLFTSRFVGDRFTVCWHAGEPLSVPIAFYQEVFERIRRASERYNTNGCEVSYSVQTNGTLISQAWCDFIKAHRIRVGVSVDGPEFIHNAHRKNHKGDGTFTQTMRGMSLLKQNGIDFHTISVLTQEALDFPDEIFQFFMENQVHRIGFNVEEVEGVHEDSSLASQAAEAHYRAFMARFWELTKQTNGLLKVREFDRICSLLYTGKRITRNQQCVPFSIVNIDNQANFSTFSPELLSLKDKEGGNFVLGNLLCDRLESVCSTEKFQRLYQSILSGVNQCRTTCQYFGVCGGGAPSNKYWENQTFNSTETQSCRLYKQSVTDILLADVEATLGLR
ncbi:MAG: cyclophane-forming radical SAM/SPASM peptide maturase GrrM/OscB [Synechococcales bacterium]|nr:cyclophane-forming radical SAM/SPASM peptide maturase GrrM/OscB [Synechococcales bacterium]